MRMASGRSETDGGVSQWSTAKVMTVACGCVSETEVVREGFTAEWHRGQRDGGWGGCEGQISQAPQL